MILSTTYSIKGTLSFEHIYDYLIVDEASQVDLATGVLAFACARNIVIVGDLQQLPNVLDSKNFQDSEARQILHAHLRRETLRHSSARNAFAGSINRHDRGP